MKFFLLKRRPRESRKVPFTTSAEHRGDVAVNCAECGAIGLIPKSLLGEVPVEIVVKDIAPLEDIEQAGSVLLASVRFREAVERGGLVGISFYDPVGYKTKGRRKGLDALVAHAQSELHLQVMHITGRGGSLVGRAGVEKVKTCDACGWQEYTLPPEGFDVDEEAWDGSDFFHCEGYAPFFMSERAVEVLQQAGLSNFDALNAKDYRPPF